MDIGELERALSEARPEAVQRELMQRALAATGATHGALFLWDKKAGGLVLTHHVVEGLTVTLPDQVLTPGSRAGIALHCFESDEPYLCRDSARDPHYTRYLLDVRSIAAAPIRYQKKPIGVLTVSTRAADQLSKDTLRVLGELAVAAAPFAALAQDEVTVGFAIALSGFVAPYDDGPYKAAQLAIDDINAKGGLLGKKIVHVAADTASDPAQGATAATDVLSKGAELVMVTCDFDFGAPAALVAQSQNMMTSA
ncbi:MAG: ABC transporter substrate-binding protein, partial [Kofleriaceae bacterium]